MNRIAVFKNMNKQYTSLLEPLFEPYSCRSGETVIQQGKPADYLYFIVTGKAEVFFKPYDGGAITVSHVEKDGLFGWSALVGSRTYTSSVRAIENLETIRIQGRELRKLCVKHPEAGREILEQIANVASSRWTNAHEQVKALIVGGMQH